MAPRDTSALLKLFLVEHDSTVFYALAAAGSTPVSAVNCDSAGPARVPLHGASATPADHLPAA